MITSDRILQIIDNAVKCQRCDIAVPVVEKLTRTKNDRIAVLQKRIKWMQNYSRGNINDLKQLKQELVDLLR